MKGTTLLIVLGIVGYLLYLRSQEAPKVPATSGSTGSTSGTGGSKTLGDFIDEAAALLNEVAKAVAGSSGSDAKNTEVSI